MPWPVHPTGFFGARGDNDTYRIERSLRFNSADSAYLNRTPASAGNRKIWTWSGWVKRSNLGTAQVFYSASETGSSSQLFFDTSNRINIFSNVASVNVYTTPRYRDVSSWYHIVVSLDTTQATASDRVKLYINGTQVTAFDVATYPAQNAEPNINNTTLHALGAQAASGSITAGVYLSSHLTEINFIDGQALTPSSFGETDPITGRWKAKAYSGTYGTNGFYLNFSDNSSLTTTSNVGIGKDFSGNGHYWATNGLSVTAGAGNDSLVDSPTNYGTDTGAGGEVRGNYATLNNLGLFDISLAIASISDGNLRHTGSATSNRYSNSSIQFNSGKYYFEITTITAASNRAAIVRHGQTYSMYHSAGLIYINGVQVSSSAATWTTNDVIGTAFDRDLGTISFYKNGSLIYSGTSLTNGNSYFELFSDSTDVLVANFGQRPFAYTAPTGFKALCTTNLPQPIIQKPSRYMDVVAYTGTGASNAISSLGFSPDLVWIKNRGTTTDHALYDTTRGTQLQLSTNSTAAEVTSSTGLTAFGSNGFTIGTSSLVNTSGTQYVAWAWDEAPIAGMDIVSYTGNGAAQTISHSLGVTPKMIIAKARSTTSDWPVYHSSSNASPQNGGLNLNKTDAFSATSSIWNNTSPTSSSFTVGTGLSSNAVTYIAYLFAEVEGFSKFGSYTGNGSADGPFVWCGFRPRWILFKASSVGGVGYNWGIYDTSRNTFNVFSNGLFPNLADAEVSGAFGDMLSNGFKLRNSSAAWNSSGQTYIFAAFAESPFKYARAR